MTQMKNNNIGEPALQCIKDIFNHVAEVGNEKELLLCFLENIDPMIEYDLVAMLFSPLTTGNIFIYFKTLLLLSTGLF